MNGNMPPGDDWVVRLELGFAIWLVKERAVARVADHYRPPEPDRFCGNLSIDRGGNIAEDWYVRPNGAGLDGKQLILPHGELPEFPSARRIAALEKDIRNVAIKLDQLIWTFQRLKPDPNQDDEDRWGQI
jgi:hypothetical protein